jgi:hypothetical protein
LAQRRPKDLGAKNRSFPVRGPLPRLSSRASREGLGPRYIHATGMKKAALESSASATRHREMRDARERRERGEREARERRERGEREARERRERVFLFEKTASGGGVGSRAGEEEDRRRVSKAEGEG